MALGATHPDINMAIKAVKNNDAELAAYLADPKTVCTFFAPTDKVSYDNPPRQNLQLLVRNVGGRVVLDAFADTVFAVYPAHMVAEEHSLLAQEYSKRHGCIHTHAQQPGLCQGCMSAQLARKLQQCSFDELHPRVTTKGLTYTHTCHTTVPP